MQSTIQWSLKAFHELSPSELYDLLHLRQKVFIMEQQCRYEDLDGKDKAALHLLGVQGETLVAYLRLLPPGLKYEEPALGRVVTDPSFRGRGAGRELVQVGIKMSHERYPGFPIRISAQSYLTRFYQNLGFKIDGPEYEEDGIPHREMTL